MNKTYFIKIFLSPLLYAGIIGVTGVCLTRLISGGTVDIVGDIEALNYFDSMTKIIAVFAALPFAANFADEWQCGITTSCIVRCGVKKYAASNVIMSFLSAFLTVIAGFLLFVFSASFIKPLYIPEYHSLAHPYTFFLKNGMALVYILCFAAVIAASSAMWSVSGMMISVIFPNKYVAFCTPFVAGYTVERITETFPPQFNLYVVSTTALDLGNGVLQFFYSIFLFMGFSAILGFIFTVLLKRRVQNELG